MSVVPSSSPQRPPAGPPAAGVSGLAPLDDHEEGFIPDDIVTGDAVVLDIPPASLLLRVTARFLDAMIQALLLFLLIWLAGSMAHLLDQASGPAMVLTIMIFVMVVWVVLWEVLTVGRSPGKIALGLRVVRDDGGAIRARHAVIRALTGLLELQFGFGVIAALLNRRCKRIGDLMAGTYVVSERPPGRTVMPAHMPVHLVGWAQSADIARIPDQLATSAAQLLGRHQMSPQALAVLALRTAQRLAGYVAPPPPAGTSELDFISAVLAERRRRDIERLTRERRRRDNSAAVIHSLPFGLG